MYMVELSLGTRQSSRSSSKRVANPQYSFPTTGCSHLQPATRPVVELASHFPPIMWLLRDSVLDVVDDGTLEAASASQVGDSTTIIRLNLPACPPAYPPTYLAVPGVRAAAAAGRLAPRAGAERHPPLHQGR